MNYKLFSIIFLFSIVLIYPKNSKALTIFEKYEKNPILTPLSNSWESERNAYQHVIFDSSEHIFKMWYAGKNSQAWSIGYAISLDGLNWIKYTNNPIMQWDGLSPDRNYLTPFVIKDNGIYKMWFTSTPDDLSNFKIGYATSLDGINWSNINTNYFLPEATKGEGAVVSPTIIKIADNDYRMWYVYNGGTNWKIGYAHSLDSLNWIKYENNPVIFKTESWEGNQLGKSSVIYDNNTFHIWYDSNSPNSNILYAFSSDGVNWTKPQSFNPVLTPGGTYGFNSFNIGAPSVVFHLDKYYLYFTGLVNEFNKTFWKIGLAMPVISPTPSPLPTQAPSPTPSPLPSPTPTPTPVVTNKVVVIPGLGGSWNLKALANCEQETNPEDWTLAPFAKQIYEPLLTTLTKSGFTPTLFTYDWRKDVRSHSNELLHKINSILQPNEQLSIVAHSLGGLVARAYTENNQLSSRLHALLTVGSPHFGASQAYGAWAGGELIHASPLWKIAYTFGISACMNTNQLTHTQSIQQYFPSIQNILPTFDYLRYRNSLNLIPVLTQTHKNNFPIGAFTHPFWGIKVGTLSGTSKPTTDELLVKKASIKEIANGEWLDGKVIRESETSEGDGTVLLKSSQLPLAENTVIAGDHGEIINGKEGIGKIVEFLSGDTHLLSDATESDPFSYGVILIHYPGHLRLNGNDRKDQVDDHGVIIIKNPEKQTYRLSVYPYAESSQLFIGQFLKNGKIYWQSKKIANITQQEYSLHVDPDAFNEDSIE